MTEDPGPTIIEPVDFRSPTRGQGRKWSWPRGLGALLLVAVVFALGAAGWFVLTAQQVQLTTDEVESRAMGAQFCL